VARVAFPWLAVNDPPSTPPLLSRNSETQKYKKYTFDLDNAGIARMVNPSAGRQEYKKARKRRSNFLNKKRQVAELVCQYR
jgi:hypothetical protein